MTGSSAQKLSYSQRYSAQTRGMRWLFLGMSVAICCAVIVVLVYAFAPQMAQSFERSAMSVFDIAAPQPEPSPPPPENRSDPDQGAQGDPAQKAQADPVSAPSPTLPQPDTPKRPPTSATGEAAQSGAREAGEGTGAAGQGLGTGSGNSGRGPGGVAVTRPQHISGAIDNARDYPIPEGGRAARRGTEVIVRVIVGIDGKARNCSIYRASPDPEADRITCELVEERLGFRPAQDANGNRVAAPFYWRQRWF